MKLSGQQIQQIQDALLSAFPSKDELSMMVRIQLEARLDTIASGENQRIIVFKLLTWAESCDRVAELIEGAYRQNPGNADLKQLVHDTQGWPELTRVANAADKAVSSQAANNPAVIDIFFSYTRKDSGLMRRLYADLREAGFSVWIDEGLEPGTPVWESAIEQAINECRCMIVLLSPDAKQSKWVTTEVTIAEDSGRMIFPVLARGDASNAVLFRLRTYQWIDLQQGYAESVKNQLLPALQKHLEYPVYGSKQQAPKAGLDPQPPAPGAKFWHLTKYRNLLVVTLLLFIGVVLILSIRPKIFGGGVVPPSEITPSTRAILEGAVELTTTASVSTVTPVLQPMETPLSIRLTNVPMPQAGATRINPKDGSDYVWVPASEFMMGSDNNDKDVPSDEKPPHPVEVDGFWIMRTEVTNAQYKRCVESGDCTAPNNDRWKDAQYADHPVTAVDWNQARSYAEWVGGRLPTEAEWEYACRGTDGRIYPWGTRTTSSSLLNYFYSDKSDTMPVGSYPPGANGLYDMAGNVYEWTSSLFAPYPYKAGDGREDLTAYGDRTLRGGSWINYLKHVRCSYRDHDLFPDLRDNLIGFRVVSSGF